MENIPVAHAILISEEDRKVFLEKNARYNWELTFFWWKVKTWEDRIDAIIRELNEEVWIEFSRDDLTELIQNDEEIVKDKKYIWTIYVIVISKSQVKQILSKENNVWLTFNSLFLWNYAFPSIYDKVKRALEKLGI